MITIMLCLLTGIVGFISGVLVGRKNREKVEILKEAYDKLGEAVKK